MRVLRRLLFGALGALALVSLLPATAAADSGWTIRSFASAIAIRSDGGVDVTERIEAQFDVPKHGIYRYIPIRYEWSDSRYYRVLRVSNISVGNGAGGAWHYTTSSGNAYELKIGDADRTLTGPVTYVIHYTLSGALNGFPDHDELYWNATGNDWGVPIQSAEAVVQVPGGLGDVACYQGYSGSNTPCRSRKGTNEAGFVSGGPLAAGQGLTVVVALAKGTVPDPKPILERKPRTFGEMFEPSLLALALFALALVASAGLAAWIWWSHGRDLQVATSPETVVPEFEPPDGLRPAQLGLVLNEGAQTRDITATIVDLAARGYLKIEEIQESGFLHSRHDYQLTRGNGDVARLQPFESVVWSGLFEDGEQVKLSDLRGEFKPKLDSAESELYKDAMRRREFTHDPRWIKLGWLLAGLGLVVLGIALAAGLGQLFGLGLPGLGIAVGGIVLAVLHHWMPQRTAAGRDLLMRTLGFRMYMHTAERYMQQFAEKERIFTAGLPYAIVFGCVDRWAHAFAGIDMEKATAGWYVGPGYLNPILFSAGLQSFSNTVGSSIAFTPSSGGSSGFGGGGFSGGGMGGGGGGSW